MVEPQSNGRPADESVGQNLAAEMLKNIIRLNDNIEKSHKAYESIAESLASLTDYHESYMRAMEMLVEASEEGKSKFTLGDLARAVSEAAAEVMPEDGEEEDEPGPEDPLVGRHR